VRCSFALLINAGSGRDWRQTALTWCIVLIRVLLVDTGCCMLTSFASMQSSGATLSLAIASRNNLSFKTHRPLSHSTSDYLLTRLLHHRCWPTNAMAEIFAAVASGAGLVSLAIQLLESSQKLKGLYNVTKDAPKNVKNLCFDLETLSLQLRQLEQHRQHDHLNTELLDRCIAQCERRTERVSDVVDEMARYISRSAAFGRLYAAFKEPEVEKLLYELEHAKSSLSLTYISYCQ
jgi:hypothetical protein